MVETSRLLLFPLTGDQLQILITDISAFEKDTSFHYDGENVEGEMYDILKGQLSPVKEAGADFVWHTFWMIVLKSENTIIGSICFKGIPSSTGSVEIGYGVNGEYESKGYTTEAVGAMIRWAFRQPAVTQITAEVDRCNAASQKVLCKNGFRKYRTVDNFDWFMIAKTE